MAEDKLKCEQCGNEGEDVVLYDLVGIEGKYGKSLCNECAKEGRTIDNPISCAEHSC